MLLLLLCTMKNEKWKWREYGKQNNQHEYRTFRGNCIRKFRICWNNKQSNSLRCRIIGGNWNHRHGRRRASGHNIVLFGIFIIEFVMAVNTNTNNDYPNSSMDWSIIKIIVSFHWFAVLFWLNSDSFFVHIQSHSFLCRHFAVSVTIEYEKFHSI